MSISERVAPRVAPPLAELTGERVTEVLPALQDIFVEELQSMGRIQEALDHFAALRRISGFPVAIRC